MRIGLVGSVGSSYVTLEKLIEHQMDIVGVWGYEPSSLKNVSAYRSMKDLCNEHKLPYHPFVKINDPETKSQIKSSSIDLLFVVGLSQLVDEDIINTPKYGCVGYHPTKLPHGRGRAPMAWMILNETEGAANFFKIDKTADSGKIYIQEPFAISADDDASSIGSKLLECTQKALDKWLPEVKKGNLGGYEQDNSQATYYARRAPLDGFIDWHLDARSIDKLIKASSRPHPGAYTFYEDTKVLIWKSKYHQAGYPTGVIGRIVEFNGSNPVVQTGNGFIEIEEYQFCDINEEIVENRIIVGSRLGYYDQYEIFKLRNQIKEINNKLNQLLNK